MDGSRPGYLLFTAPQRPAALMVGISSGQAGRYELDHLVWFLPPMWMGDGGSIVFSGLAENGVSDLVPGTPP